MDSTTIVMVILMKGLPLNGSKTLMAMALVISIGMMTCHPELDLSTTMMTVMMEVS